MKIGFSIQSVRPEDYFAIGAKADTLGFDLLMASDHLACPPELPMQYPYSDDGKPPFTTMTPWLDPIVALTYLAAATKRIKLGTNIYILPLRHPTHAAKAVATLDVLSGGRVLLGVGNGWMREEFEAADQPFDRKGARTIEMVDAMKALWTQEVAEFRGHYHSLGPITFEPKPVQKPHPPIHFSGEGPLSLRRAAKRGDGFLGMQHTPESAAKLVETLNGLRREFGREKETFEITVSSAVPPTFDNVRRFEEAGVDRVSALPWKRGASLSAGEMAASMERFADEVISRL